MGGQADIMAGMSAHADLAAQANLGAQAGWGGQAMESMTAVSMRRNNAAWGRPGKFSAHHLAASSSHMDSKSVNDLLRDLQTATPAAEAKHDKMERMLESASLNQMIAMTFAKPEEE